MPRCLPIRLTLRSRCGHATHMCNGDSLCGIEGRGLQQGDSRIFARTSTPAARSRQHLFLAATRRGSTSCSRPLAKAPSPRTWYEPLLFVDTPPPSFEAENWLQRNRAESGPDARSQRRSHVQRGSRGPVPPVDTAKRKATPSHASASHASTDTKFVS